MTAECTLKVSSPADLIAAVPYLIGFHPADSVVVVAVRDRRVVFAARHDLPEPSGPDDEMRADAAHLAALVARQGVTGATVLGYGEATRVTPTVLRVSHALRQVDVAILDELRITGGRYWSYLCADPGCCAPEGRPCPADSVIAAEATYQGAVALPDRAALVAQVAPVAGTERDAMAAATTAARQRLAGLVDGERQDAARRLVCRAGRTAVREAERRYRSGRRLRDDELAWLGVLLMHVAVRDYAWERTGEEAWRVTFWTDVVRRVDPAYMPAPACLLSFAAWGIGHGALARVAVDRALEQDPLYPMATLLAELLTLGVHPRTVLDRPTLEPARHLTDALLPDGEPSVAVPPWVVEPPPAGRTVLDERLGRVRRRQRRCGARRRAI
jgi:Domain of unknown function (DUF4192)